MGLLGIGRVFRVFVVAAVTAFALDASAAALEDQLLIVSSFPEPVYQRVTQAFERENPGVRVYVLNKKTRRRFPMSRNGSRSGRTFSGRLRPTR